MRWLAEGLVHGVGARGAVSDWTTNLNRGKTAGTGSLRVLPDLALFLLPLFAGIALLVIGALSYWAARYAAGRAAAFFARLGRNRSTTLVAIAAVVSERTSDSSTRAAVSMRFRQP